MKELQFKIFTRGSSEWTSKGSVITSPENISKIKNVLEHVGSIIIAHWHFYGSRAPDHLAFDDFDDFTEYLENNAVAGDAIDVWSMHELCNENNRLVEGKCPDKEGLIPKSGAY